MACCDTSASQVLVAGDALTTPARSGRCVSDPMMKSCRHSRPFFALASRHNQYSKRPITETSHHNERGIALVITLLVVALITAMVVEFAYGVYVSTSSLHNWQTSQKLSVAARSATKLAARLISSGMLEKTKDSFAIVQEIPYNDPKGTITVRIEDEGAKFNINKIVSAKQTDPKWFRAFKRLLENIALKPEIADRVAWWISPESRPAEGSPNEAKGMPLDSIDELLRIPGMDRESYDKLLPYVTISDVAALDSGKININTASITVLMSLHKDMTKDLAEGVKARRELNPYIVPAEIQQVPGVTTTMYGEMFSLIAATGGSYRIFAAAESGGIKRVIESVVQGGIIKFWRES